MVKRLLAMVLALASAVVSAQHSQATVRGFESDRQGMPPVGFLFSETREAAPHRWTVRRSGQVQVLEHRGDTVNGRGFSTAVLDQPQLQELEVSARIRFLSGDREAGLVWRYRDPRNYYQAELSLGGQSISLFRIADGNRVRLDVEDDLELDPEAWYTLKVVQRERSIRVYLGGIRVFEERIDRSMCPAVSVSGAAAVRSRSSTIFGSSRAWSANRVRLLVVEDEPDLARALKKALVEARFAVDVAADGVDALHQAEHVAYDAIVLDLMLPLMDGWTVLERLRRRGHRVPVLIVTARDAVSDRVRGLNAGADDYLTKPFALAELVARIHAMIRRGSADPSPVVTIGEVAIDTVTREVRRAAGLVDLTAREYVIFEFLVRRRGTLVTRATIEEHIYADDADVFSNVVDVHVAALRRKLGADVIRTKRGQGFIVDA
jgi:two-component system OmpR family response regulator